MIELNKKLNKKNIIIGIALFILPIIFEIIFFKNYKLTIDKSVILRLGYMYSIYGIIIIYNLLNRFSDSIKKIFDFILKHRYLIGLVVFIIMVMFKLSISSIGAWSNYVTSKDNQNTTIFGVSRTIRTDEWLVQSSFFLGQAMNKDSFYPLVNDNIRPDDGQNMLMVYPAPVADITIIGKPQNVGFLLLGRDFGFSWYWSMKIILLVLLSIEIAMILSKKDSFISIIGGLWIAFSPGIMWWLSSNSDIYLHAFAIIVIFYYYIRNTDWKIWKKLLLGLAMISSICGFVFCFYPPVQVPIAYVILAFILIEYILNRKKLKALDYIIITLSVLLSFGIIGYYYYYSKDAIELMMNTTYPGKRSLTGGGLYIGYLLNHILSFFTPYSSKNLSQIYNQCEASGFIYPITGLFIGIIMFFKDFKSKIRDKENYLAIALIVVFIILISWCFVGFGDIFSRITLFYMCQPGRVFLILGLVGTMLTILLISRKNDIKLDKSQSIIISCIVLLITYVIIKAVKYDVYLNELKIFIMIPILFAMTYLFVIGNKKAFMFLMFIITVSTGMVINPIERGTDAVYKTNTSKEIQNLVNENKGSLWIGKTAFNAQYLIANGAKTLNGINYYPNFSWLNKLDKEGSYKEIYNRYAHISIDLGDKTKFILVYADDYNVTLTYEDLKTLGIKFILSDKTITDEQIKEFRLEEIFSDEYEAKAIYSVN